MMKNNTCFNRLIVIAFAVLFSGLLTGCQLAVETSSDATNRDQLCGIFVTFGMDNLPVSDIMPEEINIPTEGIKVDNLSDIKDILSASFNSPRAEGKFDIENHTVQFDGVDGYYIGTYMETDAHSIAADKEFNDLFFGLNVTDEGEVQSCEGTLYVSTDFHEMVNINPVYKRADGSYYAMDGSRASMSCAGAAAGFSTTQSLDTTNTVTIDGKTTSETVKFKVTVTMVDETKQMFIKEMNQDDELIKTTEYLPDSPEQFVVDKNTAYIIVEEIAKNNPESSGIKRSIYTIDPEKMEDQTISHLCYYVDENKVAGEKRIVFIYE